MNPRSFATQLKAHQPAASGSANAIAFDGAAPIRPEMVGGRGIVQLSCWVRRCK